MQTGLCAVVFHLVILHCGNLIERGKLNPDRACRVLPERLSDVTDRRVATWTRVSFLSSLVRHAAEEQAMPVGCSLVCFGANPEASDLNIGFRKAPKTAVPL